jgi:hypothetical protein
VRRKSAIHVGWNISPAMYGMGDDATSAGAFVLSASPFTDPLRFERSIRQSQVCFRSVSFGTEPVAAVPIGAPVAYSGKSSGGTEMPLVG